MAHEIMNGEMFSVRLAPWHKQGVVLNAPPTTREAIKAAGLNWTVEMLPNFIHEHTDTMGMLHHATGSFSTVRWTEEGPYILGTVSDQYRVVQNEEAFQVFDEILLPAGYEYETAGAIKGGKKVWIMAKAPDAFSVANGDEIRKYLLLVTSHDGSAQVRFFPTAVRVVCNNTLQWALSGASEGFAIPHKGDVQNKMHLAANLLRRAEGEFTHAKAMFDLMTEHRMTELQVIRYWESIVPELKRRNEDSKRNVWKPMFEALAEGFHFGRGNRGETLWDAYNAVTEYVDHRRRTGETRIVEYAMFGGGSKMKIAAFDKAVDLVQSARTDTPVFMGVN
jgi:phage/plasmid-like protein (TIGR03299 family)